MFTSKLFKIALECQVIAYLCSVLNEHYIGLVVCSSLDFYLDYSVKEMQQMTLLFGSQSEYPAEKSVLSA